MTLHDLLSSTNKEIVFPIFKDIFIKEMLEGLWNEEKTDILQENFFNLFTELQGCSFNENDSVLHCEKVKYLQSKENVPESLYFNVYTINPQSDEHYGLLFQEWENVLGMKIDEEELNKLGTTSFLAAILNEISTTGFSREEILKNEKRIEKELNATIDEIGGGKVAEENIIDLNI